MSNADESGRPRSARDLDISTPGAKAPLSDSIVGALLVLLCCLICFLIANAAWTWVAVFGAAALAGAAWVAWILVTKRGALTWMRLAHKPSKLLARGEKAKADAAFDKALARARRFGPLDHRRGMMLVALAEYQGNQGRAKQARVLFEECIAILERYARKNPMDYFIALNNHAVFLIHLKDYAAAQQILEKVLDLTLTAKKGTQGAFLRVTPAQLQFIDFVLHLNLVCIFIELDELAGARAHLRQADALFDGLSKAYQRKLHDNFLCVRARWQLAAGKIDNSWRELEDVQNPGFPTCLRMRAKLHLHQKEYAEAESLLRRFQEEQRKKYSPHHPDFLDTVLDLAECQYHLGARDDAFETLAEARRLVADFALPHSAKWRQQLQAWLERAKEMSKLPVMHSLIEEIRALEPATAQAITILEKFRIHPQAPLPTGAS